MVTVSSTILRSPFYKPALQARAVLQRQQILRAEPNGAVSTAYCASPYKTGTTYLAGIFSAENRTSHEPAQYCTLKHLDDADFMQRRQQHLRLDLESSGFFANRLPQLRAFAPDAKIVYLYRPFEQWLESFLSYFEALDNRVSYNYVARMVFDPITPFPVDTYFFEPKDRQSQLVEALLNYWAGAYEQALLDSNTLVVPLADIDGRLDELADFLQLAAPSARTAWRRANSAKTSLDVSQVLTSNSMSRLETTAAAIERSL